MFEVWFETLLSYFAINLLLSLSVAYPGFHLGSIQNLTRLTIYPVGDLSQSLTSLPATIHRATNNRGHLSSVHTTQIHGQYPRDVVHGPSTWPVAAREPRVYGPWTRVSKMTPVVVCTEL